MDPSKIDWWDSLGGFILGVVGTITGLIGWFNKKVHSTHARISALENVRITALEHEARACAVHRAEQGQQHEENLRRLARIEEGVGMLLERRSHPRRP
jgi:hypothetical protein